jgi:ATP-dependent protease ClpP protease subunit
LNKVLKEFRENALRAVFVSGKIDAELVYRLAPAILRLRAESGDPITVEIDSLGGEIRNAEAIRGLLQTPDQRGQTVRVITVVRNVAASAAADLLALGNYAIAYKESTVHYHGSRQTVDDLTSERAARLAQNLEQTNAAYALRLARTSFGRAVFLYGNLAPEFEKFRQMLLKDEATEKGGVARDISPLECFAYGLFQRLSSENERLPRKAFVQHQKALALVNYVLPKLPQGFEKLPPSQAEAAILREVLAYEVEHAKSPSWSLSGGGMDQTTQDFTHLLDYLTGEHRGYVDRLLLEFGPLLVSNQQLSEFQIIETKPENEKTAWLEKNIRPTLEPLWYFTVCLCRLLQRGENSLPAEDAYWLGIVDEVVGSQLPNLRLLLETEPD